MSPVQTVQTNAASASPVHGSPMTAQAPTQGMYLRHDHGLTVVATLDQQHLPDTHQNSQHTSCSSIISIINSTFNSNRLLAKFTFHMSLQLDINGGVLSALLKGPHRI
jgi:hypothetical protein